MPEIGDAMPSLSSELKMEGLDMGGRKVVGRKRETTKRRRGRKGHAWEGKGCAETNVRTFGFSQNIDQLP